MVTIYSIFRFDYHKGKQPGMVNAHLPLKCPYSLIHYGIFKTLRHVKCSVIFLQYQRQVLSENFRFISLKEQKLWICKEWHVI